MTDEKSAADALRSVDLFAGLSRRALDKVAAKTRRVQHAAGKDITVEGQEGVGFHLLVDGTAEVLVGGTARRTLRAGDYFGDISVIDGKPRSATVRAKSEVTTLALTAWAFAPLLDEEPELTKALLMVMCQRLRSAEAR